MCDGEFPAPPKDDANLDQLARPIGANEHHHVVILSKMVGSEAKGMEHVIVTYSVTVGRLKDDGIRRLVRHVARILVTRKLGKLLDVIEKYN